MRGKFITFEGIDGSGKSTISHHLYIHLRSQGHDVILTQEPTKTWRGDMVTRAIEEGCDPITIALTFTADRNEHVNQIQKWLTEGKIVLCDRYLDSTLAYQGAQLKETMDNPLKWLRQIHDPFYIQPDITFLFLLDPSVAMQRIKRPPTTFENIPFLTQVQKIYRVLAKKEKRFITLDATRDVQDLVETCANSLHPVK